LGIRDWASGSRASLLPGDPSRPEPEAACDIAENHINNHLFFKQVRLAIVHRHRKPSIQHRIRTMGSGPDNIFCGGARTPVGDFGKSLRDVPLSGLGVYVAKASLARAGLQP